MALNYPSFSPRTQKKANFMIPKRANDVGSSNNRVIIGRNYYHHNHPRKKERMPGLRKLKQHAFDHRAGAVAVPQHGGNFCCDCKEGCRHRYWSSVDIPRGVPGSRVPRRGAEQWHSLLREDTLPSRRTASVSVGLLCRSGLCLPWCRLWLIPFLLNLPQEQESGAPADTGVLCSCVTFQVQSDGEVFNLLFTN